MERRSSSYASSSAPMKLKTEYLSRPSRILSASAVAVGSFDGLHIGHRKVLSRLISEAGDMPTVVFTFSPHPRAFFEDDFPLLTTDEEKTALLATTGIEMAIFAKFDSAFVEQTAEVFIDRYLKDSLGMRKLVIGSDHAIGKGRSGNIDALAKLAPQMGFELIIVEPEMLGDAPVKSTRIRECVICGDLHSAGEMLGRPFSISGEAIEGEGRGSRLGFPTVNFVPPPEKLLPPAGVFIATDTRGMPGLLYIGTAPTFGKRKIIAEFHGIDRPERIDREFGVSVLDMLRREEKFASADELVVRMRQDREKLLNWLNCR